ncbi:MAG: hypothetical protein AB7G37_21775, partial [Solirubrobacteraceae bacterium]
RSIAASPDGGHLFVGYEDDDTLSIIEIASGTNTDRQLGDTWAAEPILAVPALDGYRVLAAGTNDIYSLAPGAWDIAPEESPGIEALAYSAHTGTVFSIDGGQMLAERDPLTGALQRWALLDGYYFAPALAAHPTQPVLYATNLFEHALTAIDLDGIVVWDELDCGCDEDAFTALDFPGASLVDMAISPDGSTLYALDEDGMLFTVRTDDFTVSGSQDLGGYFPSTSLSVNQVTGEIVAADLYGTLVVIDPTTLQVARVDAEMGLWDTAISADGTKIFVTNVWESTISVVERVVPPPAPATNVRATPGARQAAVFWDASASGDPAYTVTAAGGTDALCTTTSTFCIVTGLAAGSMQFTVTATNPGGSATSSPSSAVTITAPAAPASVPAPTSGVSVSLIGGEPDTAVVGRPVQVVVTGFAPGSYVDVSLHSLPMLLGSGQVGSSGSVTVNGVIPAGVPTGAHHLVASGFTTAGAPASAVRPITLSAAPNPNGGGTGGGQGVLSRTGGQAPAVSVALGALLLAAGIALMTPRLRRTR